MCKLLSNMFAVTVTNGVRIEATSKYVQKHSDPATNVFRFTYRITITNQNDSISIQILGRQYTFESEKGQRIALPRNSPGIVGATPMLAPGQTFEYASGVDIDAPRGSITGCLHAVYKTEHPSDDNDGELFDVLVSKFALLAPPIDKSRVT
ncbi:hypothetical protein CCR75_004055 [Bremia lactucae]|uniref:ApaG domain-containing protein n=1 Tax=Bremia lactucae TaxID=4779 RepID=A0A976FFS0_BRELC|nr:hypothetical protein CCR75_004055 [Bremia lactucae]